MTQSYGNTGEKILVAIDIAKKRNTVLIQFPDECRKKFIVANKLSDYQEFSTYLKSLGYPCVIGLEATGNYHRPLAYYLQQEGFDLKLVSSVAAARTREAMYNSWDKNDPKDAQVILHMLKTGLTQTYYDPLLRRINDIQELSKTYYQISLRKTRVQHSIMTHFIPLYFPEVQKYFHSSRAEWFSSLLLRFPSPSSVMKYRLEDFIQAAREVAGRKVNKTAWLTDFYETAASSIGLPVAEDSEAMVMFRLVLQEHKHLCRLRRSIEERADLYLKDSPDYNRLRTIPGIGPVIALLILAEAGDLRRFSHYKKFLKYCGLNLSTQQSGNFRGMSKLSKHGNARLRCVFWMAGTVAIRMCENTFRKKYENYIKADPGNPDLKRKAYTAVAAKMARVAYGLIKSEKDYRCYYESSVPSGKIPSAGR
ncbi:MAG: IS110 family transposase [Candidatus Aminicenantes bacterium]|nr:MAG: IS110 family transposase [Candidatus Aminicenantes bacterium]